MAAIYESPEGPVVKKDSVEYRYTIEGTESELTARVLLLAGSATTVIVSGLLLVRKDAQVQLQGDAIDVWQGLVTYGERDRPETNESEFHFDTGGGTHHVTHSISHRSYAPPGKVAPDCKAAIGWDGNKVEGVDISVPAYNFTETHYLPVGMVTEAYKAQVKALTATVNQAVFRGHAAGEVLFWGAAGSQRGEEDWSITFKWATSDNVENLTIGTITVAQKKGWEYLDIRHRANDDQAAQAMIPEPIAAYVHQVYYDGNSGLLGLGL